VNSADLSTDLRSSPSAHDTEAAAVHLAAGVLLTWAIWVIAPLVPTRRPLASTLVASALLTAATFLALYGLARLRLRAWHELAMLILCGELWWLAGGLELRGPAALVIAAAANTFFMLACGALGRLLARLIRERNLLLAVLLTAAVVDIFTVTVGPTRHALEKAPQVVHKLALAVPKPGSAAGEKGIAGLTVAASIGLGDFIFTAMFLAAAVRHGLDASRAAVAAACLVIIAMAAVLAIPAVPALPLLPFIALGMLLANWGRFHLTRDEALQLAAGAVFLAALLGLMYVALR